jgi:two-component system, NarL family, nitrate/nitrite response regulator NarL
LYTVALCDTEPIAMEGLRSLLEAGHELRVVAAETTLPDGLDAARELGPDILIIDKAFGIHSVVDALRNLRKMGGSTVAAVWASSLSEAEALRLLQAGATGVIRKTASLDRLLDCIHSVKEGRTWMDQGMVRDSDVLLRNGRSPLTARELQIMELVERGLKNKEIAFALGICTGTVKIHLKHIFEKTGIRGRYGLAISGLKEKGLLTVDLGPPVAV